MADNVYSVLWEMGTQCHLSRRGVTRLFFYDRAVSLLFWIFEGHQWDFVDCQLTRSHNSQGGIVQGRWPASLWLQGCDSVRLNWSCAILGEHRDYEQIRQKVLMLGRQTTKVADSASSGCLREELSNNVISHLYMYRYGCTYRVILRFPWHSTPVCDCYCKR